MSHVKRGPEFRRARREEAEKRAQARAQRTNAQQLALLDQRVGTDGADRERTRLV